MSPTEAAPADSPLTLLQRLKRIQLIRDPSNMADTVLICLELVRKLTARVAKLEAENLRLRSGPR
jgi:hypothetical protein